MLFSVAIRTYEDALFQFFLNSLPTSGEYVLRNTEIFPSIGMMEFESIRASAIATSGAFSALVFNCPLPHYPSTFGNSFLQILGTVSIGSCVWHTLFSMPYRSSQPPALPLSYPGMSVVKLPPQARQSHGTGKNRKWQPGQPACTETENPLWWQHISGRSIMPDLILLPEEFGREVPREPSQSGDVQLEGVPTPDGRCTNAGCGYRIFRLLDERNSRALTPTCLACNSAYPGTPGDLDLPLLIVNRRKTGNPP